MYIVKVYREGVEYGPFDSIAEAEAWARKKYGPGFNHNWFVSEVREPD